MIAQKGGHPYRVGGIFDLPAVAAAERAPLSFRTSPELTFAATAQAAPPNRAEQCVCTRTF
jgi:hypothetical protein